MKIAIVGAGAMGVLLGVKLADAGHTVSFIDQPEQVRAAREKGLTLTSADATQQRIDKPTITADPADLGEQDLVILAVKAHHIASAAPMLAPLLDEDTPVLTLQNGLPWWYFYRHGGPFEGTLLRSLDPEGAISACIDTARIIGCTAYPAAEVTAPGVVHHVEGNRFTLGELDGSESERCRTIADALISAGFKSYVIDDIRAELWLKAWGALSFNPISALTHATMEDICRAPHTRWLAAELMREAQAIADKLGITFRHTIDKRLEGAEKVGPHKTSMLQDVEKGYALEVEALVGSVLELAELTNTPAPLIRSIYACCKLLDDQLPLTAPGTDQ
ncbi:2-dehydropantoate 2-reductase [Pseudohalioglobus sediminis]|uniref:2-dehydropantoate 2-reductase n=1 Tax=Pseudohalioglobus sediminis TaxID=2606449 RepID=A0A5B0WPQ3_9GAMM|nr:2-dehydropantoate 2-reductase [Pseudohalioglobus sediminis]KAA1188215.1 2-dehydropantoate 2-reductase [Pseudohalioglobus sediminis]